MELKERTNNLLGRQYIKKFLADKGIFIGQVSYNAAKFLNVWILNQVAPILENAARSVQFNKNERMTARHIEEGIRRTGVSEGDRNADLMRSCRLLQEKNNELKAELLLCNSRLNSAHALLRKTGERVDWTAMNDVEKPKIEEEYVSKEDLENEAADELDEITKRMD